MRMMLQRGQTAIADEVAVTNAKIADGSLSEYLLQESMAKYRSAGYIVTRLEGVYGFYFAKPGKRGDDGSSTQMIMNTLSQMSEMSTSVVNALNQAIIDMARGPKGA